MSASLKRFIYLPDLKPGESLANSYSALMIRAWEHAGYDRIHLPRGWRETLRAIRARGGTTCVANFIEQQMISGDGKVHLSGVLSYVKYLIKLHLISKNLVFVRHDVYPHWAVGKSRAIAKKLVDLSETLAFDKVLVHSSHYKGRFRKCLPHPVFEFGGSGPAGPPSDALVYLGGFGSYKKLDLLIETWDRPSRLILAGECRDVAYLDSLKAKARGKNIEFVTHLLSDDEAMRLVRSCAAMIVPQSAPSYIISSTLYFGLSCGVPVICNSLPHAKELANEGFPGIISIEDLSEINRLDIEALRAIDRREIEEATRARCSIEAVSALINQHV